MAPDAVLHPVRSLDAVVLPGPWEWALDHAADIARHWEHARTARPALFNGEVLICPERHLRDGHLHLGYRRCRYADFLYFRSLGFPAEHGGHAYGMAALQSADGAWVLGIMGAHTANAGQVYFPAGTPDPTDLTTDGRLDLAAGVLRELHEETGVAAGEVTVADGWTAVEAGATTALLRRVRSPQPGDELRERITAWLPSAPEPELDGIVLVRSLGDLAALGERVGTTTRAFLLHALGVCG